MIKNKFGNKICKIIANKYIVKYKFDCKELL